MRLYFSIIKTGYFTIMIRFNYLKFYHYLFRTTHITRLIQVCSDISNPKTLKRVPELLATNQGADQGVSRIALR